MITINTDAYEESASSGDGSALSGPLGLSGAAVVIAVLAFLGLRANGGGAILNVLSAMSWLAYDGANAYSAA
ncbi:hypothetical protein [Streptomyces phaeochromogenes]|uniref:hypothetical protein n=1 Tax=Streptomyces phaeochromogenes TaxID=1923 RepID=UPI003788FCE8